jgi:hydrogenase maturation protease
VLVLGLGNILLRDEGVGVRVVEAMEQMDHPSEVEVFDGATAGLDLLEVLADRRKVIVIDAIDGDCEPGTVLRLTPEDLVFQAAGGVSLHEIGLVEVLRAATRLGVAPQEVVILGVQPRYVTYGLELSVTLAGLLPKIIDFVLAELEA